MTRARAAAWACAGLALLAGLVGLHVVLGRPDRLAAAARRDALIAIRDQVLRYECERGALPSNLGVLVPGYVRQDELEDGGVPCYRWYPERRLLAEREGGWVRGLFSTQLAPAGITLPPPPAGLSAATRSGPGVAPAPHPTLPVEPARARPAEWVTPKGPDLPPPPEGALVFEAEHFSETNYGWEVHPDERASGGAYLHCKEGIANGPGQTDHRVGNFHDVHATRDFTMLRYHFHLPRAGVYYAYGRMWTTDTHCSNALHVSFDNGGPGVGHMENRLPFRWLWSPIEGAPMALSKGDHFLHVFIHEDGIRLDQFLLSPVPLEGGDAFAANLATGSGTAWAARSGPRVQLSFDLKSMVLTPQVSPECRLMVRRLRGGAGRAVLRAVLQEAGPDGGEVELARRELDLHELPELAWAPLDFSTLDLGKLARKEYLLVATLTAGADELAVVRVPLMKPWAWEAFGPGKYLANASRGPLDADGQPKPGDTRLWTPFADSNWDAFGVLDFGLQTSGNSLHAPIQATIYARTRIQVPKTGTYLFKFQADDQMLVWLDGKEVYRHDHERPVTRAAYAVPLTLEAGEHRLRIRVNQRETRWQASLRIRTADDGISGVTGLDAPHAPGP